MAKSMQIKHDTPAVIDRRKFIRNSALTIAGLAALKANALSALAARPGLKDLYKDDFLIGTAIGSRVFMNDDHSMLDFIKQEFNCITMENAMKWSVVHPKEDTWRFELPDKFVNYGLQNNMDMVGHVLVWHSQVPRDLFTDEKGQTVSKKTLLKRMENHIQTLVERYRGKINVWDVVNESITPEDGWRKSPWYEIIGPEFMDRAFHLAHEADPECHLIYNDYGMNDPKRRDFVVQMVQDFKKRGVPIHGIGMQGHYGLERPEIGEVEKSIEAFAETGMRVHFTELDVDVLPSKWELTAEVSASEDYEHALNPYVDGLPAEINDKFTRRYEDLFKLFLKYRDDIDRVTFWGVTDADSWKNNFPVRGRTNYPLLFDRQRNPKDAYRAVAALKEK